MIPPGGGQEELTLVVGQDEFEMPNGLCFSPDESLLYINDTPGAFINVYDVAADGSLSNGRRFAEGIGDGDLEKGGLVDGMKCDEQGNIWVTGPDGVWVIGSDGEHLGVVEIPESVGNLAWGGPTGTRCSCRRPRPSTPCRPRSGHGMSPLCARRTDG